MALFDEWVKKAELAADRGMHEAFWKDYYEREKDNYAKILSENTPVLEGTVAELAQRFSMAEDEFCGFVDGMNTSLLTAAETATLLADSALKLEIDYEKLYYNMRGAKADWLYNLPEWDGILSAEARKQIVKQFNADHIAKAEVKVGRNEPCPCGSGKKYKNCHGAAVQQG